MTEASDREHSATRPMFVEPFLTPLLDVPGAEPELRYDEQRGLSLDATGRPFIETGITRGADTLTEVRAEQDDFERMDTAIRLETVTKVAREADDFARSALAVATETRMKPEADDWARDDRYAAVEQFGGTKTGARGESDDFAREF
jgi:hypothetical protein